MERSVSFSLTCTSGRISSENGAGPQSRLGSAGRPDDLPMAAICPAHRRGQANAVCGPGGAFADPVPRDFGYRRPAGSPKPGRDRLPLAQRPWMFYRPHHFPSGRQSSASGRRRAVFRRSPHGNLGQSPCPGFCRSCAGSHPEPPSAGRLNLRRLSSHFWPLYLLCPLCRPRRKGCV
jgi:hypothetical protein